MMAGQGDKDTWWRYLAKEQLWSCQSLVLSFSLLYRAIASSGDLLPLLPSKSWRGTTTLFVPSIQLKSLWADKTRRLAFTSHLEIKVILASDYYLAKWIGLQPWKAGVLVPHWPHSLCHFLQQSLYYAFWLDMKAKWRLLYFLSPAGNLLLNLSRAGTLFVCGFF